MNNTQALETLRKSLEPKQQPKLPQLKKAVTLADAMLKIPELNTSIQQLLNIRQSEVDTLKIIEKFDFSIQNLVSQSKHNLTRIDEVNQKVASRLKQFDLFEAKFNNMIKRVNTTLDSINRVLETM